MSRRSHAGLGAYSIFAVLDGLLLFLALEGAFYAVAFLGLHLSFDTPTTAYLTCNLVWAVLAALAGGYTAARVAGTSPLLHGLVTAVPLLILAAYNLNKGIGGRLTPFVVLYNVFVPLAVVAGAALVRTPRD